MTLSEQDRLFCLRYVNEFVREKSIKLSDLYADVYSELSNGNSRDNRTQAERLLKKQGFKDEIAKYTDIGNLDVLDETAIKEFVKKQLLNMYQTSSTIIRKSDRNGCPTEELKYLDSTTATRTLELLGKSTDMFKERVVMEEDTWEIGTDTDEKEVGNV